MVYKQIENNHININSKKVNRLNNSDFMFVLYDGKKIPFEDNAFDLITIFMVLHHIPDNNLYIFLKEVYLIISI